MPAWLVLLALLGWMGLGLNAGVDALMPGDESVAQSEADGDHCGPPSPAGPRGHPAEDLP